METNQAIRGGTEMTRIDVLLNDAGERYLVNETLEEVNRKLNNVKMGNQDFMVFEDTLKGGIYQIKKLIISPKNCAVIEISEV